jgi:hypothetical protein
MRFNKKTLNSGFWPPLQGLQSTIKLLTNFHKKSGAFDHYILAEIGIYVLGNGYKLDLLLTSAKEEPDRK